VSRVMSEKGLNWCASLGLLLSLLLFNSLVFSNLMESNSLRSSSLLIVHGIGLLAIQLICNLEKAVAVFIVKEAHHFLDLLILFRVGFLRVVGESLATRARDQRTFKFLLVDPTSLEQLKGEELVRETRRRVLVIRGFHLWELRLLKDVSEESRLRWNVDRALMSIWFLLVEQVVRLR